MLCQGGRNTSQGLGLRDYVPLKNMALCDISFHFYIKNAVSKFYHTKWMVSNLVVSIRFYVVTAWLSLQRMLRAVRRNEDKASTR